MLHAALAAPLSTPGMVLVERLFTRVMKKTFDVHTAEQWPGQFDELLMEARRKVRTGR